jgi:hypothetical protein
MKLGLISSLGALVAITACATSTRVSGDPTGAGGGTPDGGGGLVEDGDEDPATQPPHSLGTIVLGESHGASGSSLSTPIVTATFSPDAALGKSCKTKLAGGCEIVSAPKCTKSTTTGTGCLTNEACVFDDGCTAVCKAFSTSTTTCETGCDADEVCKVTGTTASCVKVQTFDAGPIAFSGTTTTITLFPPYRFATTGQGAPFLGGAQIQVQAQGALEAGFEKFDEKFTATTFVQTDPPLGKIPRATVFGSGAIPVGWAPSAASTSDAVIVTVAGSGGTATCKVKDTAAKFDIPRAVVKAAQGEMAESSAPVSISITRQRKELHKDKKAKGELALTKVVPEAWLELVTQSSETASFQGCTSSGQSLCGDTCTDTRIDVKNCGACGKSCTAAQTCSSGVCTGSTASCVSCKTNAKAGACSSQSSNCELDANCSNLSFCVAQCTTASCVTTCNSNYPSGVSRFAALKSCWDTQCASACPF